MLHGGDTDKSKTETLVDPSDVYSLPSFLATSPTAVHLLMSTVFDANEVRTVSPGLHVAEIRASSSHSAQVSTAEGCCEDAMLAIVRSW